MMNPQILQLRSDEIAAALAESTRQYLVGNLQRPQMLANIPSDRVEVGITRYSRATAEQPHSHTNAFEFQYMISGYTAYLDVNTGKEYSFRKGDFYVIEPGVLYAQKSKAGTEILFFKMPPGNDKIPAAADEQISNWLAAAIPAKRKDYFHVANSPRPNSLRPAAAVAVRDDSGKVLFLRRLDNEKWTLPGGTLEFGETLLDCAIREVREETGYRVEIDGLVGTYTDPQIVVAYSDGEVRQEFTFVYHGHVVSGRLIVDQESSEATWVHLDQALELPMADSQALRIQDLQRFFKDNVMRLR